MPYIHHSFFFCFCIFNVLMTIATDVLWYINQNMWYIFFSFLLNDVNDRSFLLNNFLKVFNRYELVQQKSKKYDMCIFIVWLLFPNFNNYCYSQWSGGVHGFLPFVCTGYLMTGWRILGAYVCLMASQVVCRVCVNARREQELIGHDLKTNRTLVQLTTVDTSPASRPQTGTFFKTETWIRRAMFGRVVTLGLETIAVRGLWQRNVDRYCKGLLDLIWGYLWEVPRLAETAFLRDEGSFKALGWEGLYCNIAVFLRRLYIAFCSSQSVLLCAVNSVVG